MSDSPPSRKWIPRAWIALLVMVITPVFVPFAAFGLYSGCKYFDIQAGTSPICDMAGAAGFIAFAWYPYILLACAIFAVMLGVIQFVGRNKSGT